MEKPSPMTYLPATAARLRNFAFTLLAVAGMAGCAGTPMGSGVPAATSTPVVVGAVPEAVVEALPTPEPADPIADVPALARGRLDPADDAARTDLWARVRTGFVLPELEGELVRKWEQWYSSRPDYVQRMTERGGRYLFHIVEELQRREMPAELALLPFVESAFNPQALSASRAAGMWQFMPQTGKDFELKQNLFRDDRRDVLASTRAALDYLQQLHEQFGDWQLALAAYNWGQGNVQKAIARNRRAGLPADYANLRLPDETRNYVPKLQAVKNIVSRPADFGLVLPALENHPFFLGVPVDRDIDVALAARLAGLPLEEFQQLNPQLNKPVILAAGTQQVLLPYDNANRFLRQVPMYSGPLASWTAWVAPKTLTPREVARQVGMPEEQLREVNHIPARMLVKAGSTLLVPRTAPEAGDVTEHVAETAAMLLTPDGPPLSKVSFKAGKKGDTVTAVARRYHARPEQVAQWNGVGTNASFRPGQMVVVMQAPRATHVAVRRSPPQHSAKPPTRTRVAMR
jgi:membrane-bound lytic murein transglycosylase D